MRMIRSRSAARVLLGMWMSSLWPVAVLAVPDVHKTDTVNLAQTTTRTLLQFPFDVTAMGLPAGSDLKGLLSDVSRSRLIASGAYTVSSFYKGLPPIARLVNDQGLSDKDIAPPFADDNVKAPTIAKKIGYEMVFVGSLDDYQYDAATNQATVTVSGRLVDVTTGKVVGKSVTLSSTSDKGGKADEPGRAEQATRTAGEKLMTALVPSVLPMNTMPVVHTASPSHGHRNNTGWIWGAVALGLGLGFGLSGGHSSSTPVGTGGGNGGGNTGGDLPPAPPR